MGGGSLLLLFSGGGSPAAASLPGSLPAAILARWSAQGLDATAGPLYQDSPAPGSRPPYAVFRIRRGGLYFKSSTSQFDDVRVTFRVRSTTAADARSRADAVDSAAGYLGAGLAWQTGLSVPAVRTNRHRGREPGTGIGGLTAVFYDAVEFQVRARGEH